MSYIIGVIVGGFVVLAFYELLVLPLLVGRPRALWGKAPHISSTQCEEPQ